MKPYEVTSRQQSETNWKDILISIDSYGLDSKHLGQQLMVIIRKKKLVIFKKLGSLISYFFDIRIKFSVLKIMPSL